MIFITPENLIFINIYNIIYLFITRNGPAQALVMMKSVLSSADMSMADVLINIKIGNNC